MQKNKILIISHNPVGGATSSGRTIETFITDSSDVDYFNLYISNESHNLLDRVEYFQLSERQLIKGGRILSKSYDRASESSIGLRIEERTKPYISRIISLLKKRYRWHFQHFLFRLFWQSGLCRQKTHRRSFHPEIAAVLKNA